MQAAVIEFRGPLPIETNCLPLDSSDGLMSMPTCVDASMLPPIIREDREVQGPQSSLAAVAILPLVVGFVSDAMEVVHRIDQFQSLLHISREGLGRIESNSLTTISSSQLHKS